MDFSNELFCYDRAIGNNYHNTCLFSVEPFNVFAIRGSNTHKNYYVSLSTNLSQGSDEFFVDMNPYDYHDDTCLLPHVGGGERFHQNYQVAPCKPFPSHSNYLRFYF